VLAFASYDRASDGRSVPEAGSFVLTLRLLGGALLF
jgi:hypothetical protein